MRNPPPLKEEQVRILKSGSHLAVRMALGISEFFDVKLGRNYHETFEWVAAQTGMSEAEWDALLYEATEDSESY